MATKPQNKSPQRYADGGAVGLQPTLALADGGSLDQGGKGPWGGDLNSSTTTFNQDWLRGPSFGEQNLANLINYAPPAAPAAAGGNPDNRQPLSAEQQAALDAESPDQRAARLSNDLPGLATGMAGVVGLGKVAGLAKGAYGLYNGYTTGESSPGNTSEKIGANLGAGMGLGPTLANAAFGTTMNPAGPANPMQQDPATRGSISQAPDQMQPAPTLDTPATPAAVQDGVAPATDLYAGDDNLNRDLALFKGAAPGGSTSGGSGSSNPGPDKGFGPTDPSGFGTMGGGGYGTESDGAGNSQHLADGGPVGMPSAQPPGPPGLQMPGAAQPTQPPAGPMHPALANLHVQNKMANPQIMQAVQAHLNQAIQAGQLNPQQLQMMGQLAQSAIQHPELWPKLRQFAIQAGLPDAQQLPMQFDQGIAMALMAASHASQHGDRPGAFANGGMLHGQGSGTSDSIPAQNHSTGQPVKLSNGEYIIPADVVATKGKEFFDSIVRKYHTPAAMQQNR